MLLKNPHKNSSLISTIIYTYVLTSDFATQFILLFDSKNKLLYNTPKGYKNN